MNISKKIIQYATEGIQNKKGSSIVIADLSKIEETICSYLIICQGNTPTQVAAIVDSVCDAVRIGCGEKPSSIDGLHNAQWVALDYGDVLVHIFTPETRTFYDLEHLWEDARLKEITDID